jgi:hypothetical protein
VITIFERKHLRSAMYLSVALFYAIKSFTSALALSRLGTRSIECHFGIVRSALRGQGQWRLWCGIDAFAALLRAMNARPGLATRPHAGRVAIAGIKMVRTDDGLQFGHPVWTEPGSEERAMVLHCAKAAVKGDKGAMAVKWSCTCAFVEHVRRNPIRIGSSPSPRVGSGAEGRW